MNRRIDIDVREGTVSHNMGRIEVLLLAFYIPYLSVQLEVNNLLCKTSCTYAIGVYMLSLHRTRLLVHNLKGFVYPHEYLKTAKRL